MSLILKGIDLPTDGKTLIVGIYGNGLVSMEYTKPLALAIEINAEAIQIPQNHGRLIDENKIDIPSTSVDIFENCGNCNLLDDEQVKEIIADTPTILEAET